MFHKVKYVKPLPDYSLLVVFLTGEQKQYDVKPLFHKWESFKLLTLTNDLFNQVKVDAGGYGIAWNDSIDLSCDELYYNGLYCRHRPYSRCSPDKPANNKRKKATT